ISANGPSDHHQHSFIFTQCNACLYDGGGKRSTRSKPTQARGEHANSTQKGPGTTSHDQDSSPGPSRRETTVLTTEPPCCPIPSLPRTGSPRTLNAHIWIDFPCC